MPTIEARLVQIERQLGRELTPEERQLMHLWYDTFEVKKPSKTTEAKAARYHN